MAYFDALLRGRLGRDGAPCGASTGWPARAPAFLDEVTLAYRLNTAMLDDLGKVVA